MAEITAALVKALEVGRYLDIGAVFLHSAHDAHHGLTHGEPGRKFLA